jgi:uncharacterized protein (DUF983 family)
MAQQLELSEQEDPRLIVNNIGLHSSITRECPDCQSSITEFYTWDKVRYVCENCGILINESTTMRNDSLDELEYGLDLPDLNDNNKCP